MRSFCHNAVAVLSELRNPKECHIVRELNSHLDIETRLGETIATKELPSRCIKRNEFPEGYCISLKRTLTKLNSVNLI